MRPKSSVASVAGCPVKILKRRIVHHVLVLTIQTFGAGRIIVTGKNGLLDDAIFRILDDDNGNLWISSDRGVFRVSLHQLNDLADHQSPSPWNNSGASTPCAAPSDADAARTLSLAAESR